MGELHCTHALLESSMNLLVKTVFGCEVGYCTIVDLLHRVKKSESPLNTKKWEPMWDFQNGLLKTNVGKLLMDKSDISHLEETSFYTFIVLLKPIMEDISNVEKKLFGNRDLAG